MIEKLKLKSFQAHKNSELKFCPGVNCIIGESDEGKTSILRALYWTSQNKPSGGNFISNFSNHGECSSTIIVDNNEITRFKNKIKNEYQVNDQSFKALSKSGVPEEVKNILQLDELNFQNQMDSPFLLSSNSGEVARYLNNIVNLNVIDESLKKINIKTNTCNRDIKSKEEDIERLCVELNFMGWVETAEKELINLDLDNIQYEKHLILNTDLANLLNDTDDLLKKIEKYQDNDDEEYQIKLLIDEYKTFQITSDHNIGFKVYLNDVKAISNKINSLPFDQKEIESIALLSTLIDSYLIKDKVLNQFLDHLEDIDGIKSDLNAFLKAIKIKEIEFKKNFPDECPLCGDLTR